jgi:ComF family protein
MTMIDDFISLFFPRYCLGCKGPLLKGEQNVCLHCFVAIPKTNSHLDENNFIAVKFYGKIQLTSVWAYYTFQKSGIVQELLHNLKYNNRPTLAVELGNKYANELLLKVENIPFDIIVPVPLHFKKQKLRGYNQSEQFALGLEQVFRIPVFANALKRTKYTSTQTSKSRMERWKNVDQIFETNDVIISGKHVLLVDDVITTGSTIESCAYVLLQGGAKEVSIIALAAAK